MALKGKYKLKIVRVPPFSPENMAIAVTFVPMDADMHEVCFTTCEVHIGDTLEFKELINPEFTVFPGILPTGRVE